MESVSLRALIESLLNPAPSGLIAGRLGMAFICAYVANDKHKNKSIRNFRFILLNDIAYCLQFTVHHFCNRRQSVLKSLATVKSHTVPKPKYFGIISPATSLTILTACDSLALTIKMPEFTRLHPAVSTKATSSTAFIASFVLAKTETIGSIGGAAFHGRYGPGQ
ncbi:hypothetical protein LXM25_20690 [Dyadobacter sp. LJ53]|uniref:hypothetical protein n=1 Tax=Dyadobacter chenwenxiniae TaxID=2906456 RepID=UPI001F39F9B6|nr:hypothetical protein [Dyadobacter chenwenxiniae]MCF0052500.1 hypothetical protein [Dyadobacter chenwenxiniae]